LLESVGGEKSGSNVKKGKALRFDSQQVRMKPSDWNLKALEVVKVCKVGVSEQALGCQQRQNKRDKFDVKNVKPSINPY
jgi:hypothetical protein